jgi:membrane protease YdiL (CAAX protease family)
MERRIDHDILPQYSIAKILLIWTAAALPMSILGWLVAPAIAVNPQKPGFERLAVLTVGLVWQFVLVVFLLYRETGTLRWSELKHRLWLYRPLSPHTGQVSGRMWLWLIPLLFLTAIYEMLVSGFFDAMWVSAFPFFAEPQGFSLDAVLGTPAARQEMVGAWGLFGLFILSALFNTFLGEELLFRGLLLPRMAGAFGKWDWLMNGVFFGLYHLHQPWGMLSGVIAGSLLFALPTRLFRCSWFGIIAHSGQSIYFAFLILGLVLGLA